MKDEPIDTSFIKRAAQEKEQPFPQWREAKKQLIVQALIRNNGSPVAAARELGISRRQMWEYRKAYGLPIFIQFRNKGV